MSKVGQGFLTTTPLHRQLRSEPQALRSTGSPSICSVSWGYQWHGAYKWFAEYMWSYQKQLQNYLKVPLLILWGWGTQNSSQIKWKEGRSSIFGVPQELLNMLTFTELLRTLTFTELFQKSLPIQHPSPDFIFWRSFPPVHLSRMQVPLRMQHSSPDCHAITHACTQEQKEPLTGSNENKRPTLSLGPRNTGWKRGKTQRGSEAIQQENRKREEENPEQTKGSQLLTF